MSLLCFECRLTYCQILAYVLRAEDEQRYEEELRDLIDDNPIEEGEDSEGEGEGGAKRKHDESDVDEDLEDEDYDLLEENLGIKVQRVSEY